MNVLYIGKVFITFTHPKVNPVLHAQHSDAQDREVKTESKKSSCMLPGSQSSLKKNPEVYRRVA